MKPADHRRAGDPDHPANFGRLCTRAPTCTSRPAGRHSDQRLPVSRWCADRSAAAQPLPWDQAKQQIAEKLLALRRGMAPRPSAFYHLRPVADRGPPPFNKLAAPSSGTPHRLQLRGCYAISAGRPKQSLGSRCAALLTRDIELADCVLISRRPTRPGPTHPVPPAQAARTRKSLRVSRASSSSSTRAAETAELADLHLQIRAGTDVALCHGLLRRHLERLDGRRLHRPATEGFEP